MEKENNLEYRMYGLVNYQLSGTIHAGIQFGHAVVEYAQKYFKDPDYQEWAKLHKTFIILNGGTTNNGSLLAMDPNYKINIVGPNKTDYKGSMQNHLATLNENKIKISTFSEPDLNDALTAIVFLVDERVFNKTKYPPTIGSRELEREPSKKDAEKWATSIGGKKNAFLRDFLSGFRLA